MKEINESKLEKSLIEWFIENTKQVKLVKQLQTTKVLKRYYSGAGFFYKFSKPEESLALSEDEYEYPIDGPGVKWGSQNDIKGLTMLFLQNGLISMLEVCTVTDHVPEIIEDFILEQVVYPEAKRVRELK